VNHNMLVLLNNFRGGLFDQNFFTSKGTARLFPNNTNVVDVYGFRPKNADRYFGVTFGT